MTCCQKTCVTCVYTLMSLVLSQILLINNTVILLVIIKHSLFLSNWTARGLGKKQKTKGDRKRESNDSPEIPDKGLSPFRHDLYEAVITIEGYMPYV